MDQRLKDYLLKLAKADKDNAAYNLYRANRAAHGRDTSLEWGQSGQSLQSIIDEYQEWHDDADKTIKELEALS